jgi:membrane-associated protease RseP (regulator of RpoE activity)
LPLGALLFTGFQWSVAAWTGFVLTILFHEFGHAYLCRRYGARVIAIDLHGFGGLCTWQGEVTAMQRAKIAWGGVVAQGIVFAVTYVACIIAPPETAPMLTFSSALLWTNVRVALWNLVPIPPLDGFAAWPLLGMWFASWRARRQRERQAKARAFRDAATNSSKKVLEELDALEAELDQPPPEVAELVEKATADAFALLRDGKKKRDGP